MANAVATLTLAPSINARGAARDETQQREILYGTCGLSAGGTYQANGVPLSWSFTAADGNKALVLSTQSQPQFAEFFSNAGGTYQYNFDTTHNTLRIIQGGAELAAGAAITADSIGFRAEFIRGL